MYLLVVLSVVTASAAICPANNGMNDTIRQKFLDVHNELRRLVASGKAEDGAGGNAPQAAAMPELTYDCEVEKYAIAHAAKCQFQHSDGASRAYNGENIYMRSPVYDKVRAAEDSSRAWFSELKKFGVGTNLVLDQTLWSKGVGHYTQMVWQSTKAIGCAVQDCPTMSLVVCNYNPAGNMMGSKLYEAGTPCSKCPRGCSNNLCVDEEPSKAPEQTATVPQGSPEVPVTTTVLPQESSKVQTTTTVVPQGPSEVPVTTTVVPQGPVPKPTVTKPASSNSKNKKKNNKKKSKKQKNKKNKQKNNKKNNKKKN